MEQSIILFLRLFLLIGKKLFHLCITKSLSIFVRFLLILKPNEFFSSCTDRLLCRFIRNARANVGLVILTRFAIPERASVLASAADDNSIDQLQSTLVHASLLERILTELTSQCVAVWLQLNTIRTLFPSLFLVYRRSYTSAFTLSNWLSILPDHSLAKAWYQKRNESKRLQPELVEPTQRRVMEILSCARFNANHHPVWEDPSVFYSPDDFEHSSDSGFARNMVKTWGATSFVQRKNSKVEYVGVAGIGFSRLLEVALRAALRSGSDYVIVLNTRAFGLRPEHIELTVRLLHGCDLSSVKNQSSCVDVVLGISKPCSVFIPQSGGLLSSPRSPTSDLQTGLYLLGIRGGPWLTLHARSLTESVEWSCSSTASRLWSNIIGTVKPRSVVCLRERLEELAQPVDLMTLENRYGIPPTQFLDDNLSVIIPMGPGHPDDRLDLNEDFELVDVNSSKALVSTLEVLVHNATGRRPIQVIIIDSSSTSSPNTSSSSASADVQRFRRTRLRSMITVSVCHFKHTNAASSVDQSSLPRRGELIRYAVENFAKGSMLLFIEPGTQLPLNWDSAIYHSLQRPGVGMGCFAYRLHLHDKYINRKSIDWAINCWLANYLVNVQTRCSEIPIVSQPLFIYTHYLVCVGGYPTSSRTLHPIDLAVMCHKHLGRVVVTCPVNASAGIPANFALRHGAYRTALYTAAVAFARYVGASETELRHVLSADWPTDFEQYARYEPLSRLPLVQPSYLDGY